MRIRTKLTSSLAVAGALALTAVSIAPAQAVPSSLSCPAPAVAISNDICQVVFTTSGSWTVPTGIDLASALVVGGGGGSINYTAVSAHYYAGGGGDVRTYSLPLTTAAGQSLTVNLGAGGAGSTANSGSAANGTPTIILNGSAQLAAAAEGEGGTAGGVGVGSGGDSGGGQLGVSGITLGANTGGAGGGAGAGGFQFNGGAGLWPSAASARFPLLEPNFALLWPASLDTATGYSAEFGAGGWVTVGSGTTPPGNGGIAGTFAGTRNGGNGLAIIRFTFAGSSPASPTATQTDTSAALASTGSDASTWGVLAAIAALAGAAALGIRRKVRDSDA